MPRPRTRLPTRVGAGPSAAGESARQLARRLGGSPSTVSREIARNGGRERRLMLSFGGGC
ncbi:helix-turn-helix domain-containing protein [Streptomyces sp. NPDC051664]|uniref:helix-turn-helix domain-containing protein n=1 Tax=Streptomyces sp. NPDC051664 TaxID=3365668 RepID=UPI0037A47CB4